MCTWMDRSAHYTVTMPWRVPTLCLLLCTLSFYAKSDASVPSPQLPSHILMSTVIVVDKPPVRLDILSVRWEHDGRPLVEYKEGNVTIYDSRALVPLEQFKDGNISLVLTNLTLGDSGNYTCAIQYGKQQEKTRYILIIEENMIHLLNLASDSRKTGSTADGDVEINRMSKRRRANTPRNGQTSQDGMAAPSDSDEAGDAPSTSPSAQEPAEKFKTIKIGLVFGVVATTGFLAAFIFFCFEG